MQDGASPHTAKQTIELLKKYFGEKIISNKLEDFWPPYSPDLNPCDYFLWGFLKDKVFSEKINNCNELKEKITQICSEIKEEICKKVINNLIYRLHYCIKKSGKHFANIMKKSHIPLNIVNPNNIL
jgi:transposase